MRRRRITTALATLALLGSATVGCSDDDGGGTAGAGADDPTGTTEAAAPRDRDGGGTGAEPAGWEEVRPGGDCRCADGSDYSLFVRDADPERVVLYLRAGGACWNAETCAQDGRGGTEEIYTPAVDDHPTGWDGMFDLGDERNPFADHSFVYAPYCTGDVFLGDATTTYEPGLTVQHKGFVNGTAAVDLLAERFPGATEVVVVGLSAGSVAAPLYGGLVAERFPDARVTVLADSSGAYPAAVGELVAEPWGVAGAQPDWPGNAGLTPAQLASPTGLYVRSGQRSPDVTFARHDFAHDEVQALFLDLLGMPGDPLPLLDANEAEVEAAGVPVATFTSPGDDHGAVQNDGFYDTEVDGVTLAEWVASVVAGEPVDDVHCTDCGEGDEG
jgi:hypothetical protein